MRLAHLILSITLVSSVTTGPARAGMGADAARPCVEAFSPRRPLPALDPNLYENSLGTMVVYDNQLRREYDDGYGPDAHEPFEALLARHGTWFDTPELGRVWSPSKAESGDDFAPYRTNGRWMLTSFGWTWSSNWSWGWAPFHYGRWAYLAARGWCWIPGTLWGPAWVAWRTSRHYVAWAPLPPKGMDLGRPLGTRSPWWMVQARVPSSSNEVPRRTVPALFGLTVAISHPKTLTSGGVSYRINTGPTTRGDFASSASPVDVHATPQLLVPPRQGISLKQRPWVLSSHREQTPICPWPPDGAPDRDTCPSTRPLSTRSAENTKEASALR
jgi:hypothetical protein